MLRAWQGSGSKYLLKKMYIRQAFAAVQSGSMAPGVKLSNSKMLQRFEATLNGFKTRLTRVEAALKGAKEKLYWDRRQKKDDEARARRQKKSMEASLRAKLSLNDKKFRRVEDRLTKMTRLRKQDQAKARTAVTALKKAKKQSKAK
jgi:hypothetical protein